MSRLQLTRRTALIGGTAALGLMSSPSAIAKAPFARTQAPYFYRFPIGDFQATVVSDGTLSLGDPSGALKGLTKEEITQALTDNFLPVDNIKLEQNVVVLNTGARLALFDSGMGTSRMFGPTTGRLLANLKDAGINPASVDDVICSHAHIDHVGGLADPRGKRYFPNATVNIAKADYDFWTDEKNSTSGPVGQVIAHARQNLLPYKGRIKFFEDGKDVIPGVQAMSAPGHTVGHTIFVIKSGSKVLVYTADIAHHQILLTEKPKTQFAYDTDPQQAVQSRLRVFDMIASQRLPMLAYHFPWPGYGHLARHGDGYRYHPHALDMVPAIAKS
jgi:glyoxylase-like metal-dependent hydrolase (beta-lactamase superfamily II)